MPNNNIKAREKRLLKKYNLTLEDYAKMLLEQSGGCDICGKKPTGLPLHVDHDHALRYAKVKTTKLQVGWLAETFETKYGVVVTAKTKSSAIQGVRKEMLRKSVRSLLCWRCNSMLKWGNDNPEIIKKAAEYLERHNDKFR